MTDKPELGFINAPANRAASLRGDVKWFEQHLNNQNSKVVVFVDDRPAILVSDNILTIDFKTVPEISKLCAGVQFILLYLTDNGQAVFAVQLGESFREMIAHGDTKLIDLRSLAMQAILPPESLGALAQARSLLNWHAFHRFCANCGRKTIISDAGYRRDCENCKRQHFPRVDPVVIMLIQHGDSFLMGRGHNFEENHYSALAGFVEPGETIEAATRRETYEETGIKVGEVKYLISQPWPFPSTLMIGVIGQAVSTDIAIDPVEIAQAQWFSFDEIRLMLNNDHPNGTTLPPPMSIAYQMMKGYLDGDLN